MITVIRNDVKERYAHDVYDIKIKEELPNYKLMGTTRNEGVCLYESPNYAAVANTFDIIIEAITSGQKTILILPPVSDKIMTKEEFNESISNIHDFRVIDDDHPILPNQDMYGRKIDNCNSVYETPTFPSAEFYAWNENNSNIPDAFNKNGFNNKYLNNVY